MTRVFFSDAGLEPTGNSDHDRLQVHILLGKLKTGVDMQVEVFVCHVPTLEVHQYTVLVYFPIVFEHCNPGLRHVVIPVSIMIDEHWIYGRKEHRMYPFLDVSATRNQSRLDDRVNIMGASNVVDVLGEIAR